jgi:hypothetical protein
MPCAPWTPGIRAQSRPAAGSSVSLSLGAWRGRDQQGGRRAPSQGTAILQNELRRRQVVVDLLPSTARRAAQPVAHSRDWAGSVCLLEELSEGVGVIGLAGASCLCHFVFHEPDFPPPETSAIGASDGVEAFTG